MIIRGETVERGDNQIFTSASSGDYKYYCRKLKRMAYDGNVKTAALTFRPAFETCDRSKKLVQKDI